MATDTPTTTEAKTTDPKDDPAYQEFLKTREQNRAIGEKVNTDTPNSTFQGDIESEYHKVFLTIRDFLEIKFPEDIRMLDNLWNKYFHPQ